MQIVDFDCRLLNQMDEGVRNLKDTENILKSLQKCGIETVISAPYFDAAEDTAEVFLKDRLRALEAVRDLADARGIRIIPAARVRLFPGVSKTPELGLLKIRHTSMMLVEMPLREWTDEDLQEVQLLKMRGILPVISRFEDFLEFQTSGEMVVKLLQMKPLFQVDAGALLKRSSKKKLLELFETNNAQFLGSCGEDEKSHPKALLQARALLEKKFGPAFLEDLDRYTLETLHLE